MPPPRAQSRFRRPPDQYHHGNLREALLKEALRAIHRGGVESLTLRSVGERLGVSRTALYRHFRSKNALLATVAGDGFRMLRLALASAWDQGGGGRAGFTAMGGAYVHFALANPSHYRVMFGGFLARPSPDATLMTDAPNAFQVLVDALVDLQRAGAVRRDDPRQIARCVWALVHGIAMLAIDGHLTHQQADVGPVAALALERIWSGIGTAEATDARIRQRPAAARR